MLLHIQTFKNYNVYLDEAIPALINIVNQPIASEDSRLFMEETIRLYSSQPGQVKPMGVICDLRRIGGFDSYSLHILQEQLPVFAQYAGAPSLAFVLTAHQADVFASDAKPQAMNRDLKCPIHVFDNIDDARTFYRKIFSCVRAKLAA